MAKKPVDETRTYLSPKELINALVAVIVHNYKLKDTNASDAAYLVPMIWGSPGLGKTRCVYTATELARQKLGIPELPVVLESIADKSPEEITGYPRPDGEDTFRRLMPHKFYDQKHHPMVAFFDEYAQGNVEQQNVGRGAMLGQTVGELKFAPGSTVIAASNLMEDRAGTNAMPSHVKDVLIHLYVRADHNEWCYWAASSNIDPDIISFIKVHGAQWLHDLEPKATVMSCPSPRSWEKVNRILHLDSDEASRMAMIAGTVGPAAAGAFQNHRRVGKEMPDIEAILKGKGTMVNEGKPDLVYMTMCALASQVTAPTMPNLVKYLKKMKHKEFASFCMNMALNRDKKLEKAEGTMDWLIENEADLIF